MDLLGDVVMSNLRVAAELTAHSKRSVIHGQQ
jgi:hypothetical protein